MKTVGQRNTFVAHIDEGTNVADGIPCIACEGKRSAIHWWKWRFAFLKHAKGIIDHSKITPLA